MTEALPQNSGDTLVDEHIPPQLPPLPDAEVTKESAHPVRGLLLMPEDTTEYKPDVFMTELPEEIMTQDGLFRLAGLDEVALGRSRLGDPAEEFTSLMTVFSKDPPYDRLYDTGYSLRIIEHEGSRYYRTDNRKVTDEERERLDPEHTQDKIGVHVGSRGQFKPEVADMINSNVAAVKSPLISLKKVGANPDEIRILMSKLGYYIDDDNLAWKPTPRTFDTVADDSSDVLAAYDGTLIPPIEYVNIWAQTGNMPQSMPREGNYGDNGFGFMLHDAEQDHAFAAAYGGNRLTDVLGSIAQATINNTDDTGDLRIRVMAGRLDAVTSDFTDSVLTGDLVGFGHSLFTDIESVGAQELTGLKTREEAVAFALSFKDDNELTKLRGLSPSAVESARDVETIEANVPQPPTVEVKSVPNEPMKEVVEQPKSLSKRVLNRLRRRSR